MPLYDTRCETDKVQASSCVGHDMQTHKTSGALTQILDWVLPPTCAGCGEVLDQADTLCPDCWSTLSFIAGPCCDACGHPFAYEVPERTLCGACIQDRPPFSRARAALYYDAGSKGFILGLKHGDKTDVAHLMAKWLRHAGAVLLKDADVIVPIPLHWTRLFQRRYNQSALLARALGRAADKPVDVDVLVRHKKTASQGYLGVKARSRNVAGAFRVPLKRRARIRGKRVVLVDDVYTTGATLRASAKALLRAGAQRVDVVTLARVVKGT